MNRRSVRWQQTKLFWGQPHPLSCLLRIIPLYTQLAKNNTNLHTPHSSLLTCLAIHFITSQARLYSTLLSTLLDTAPLITPRTTLLITHNTAVTFDFGVAVVVLQYLYVDTTQVMENLTWPQAGIMWDGMGLLVALEKDCK